MHFPYSMLLDFVQTRLSAEEAGDLLTMAGFELEGIESVEGEPVLEIKVVSNRGDGLSVFGLAREVLAKDPHAEPTDLYRRAAGRFKGAAPNGDAGPLPAADLVAVETEDCTRYACRIFGNVRNGEAPEWVRERLRKAGMRPISLLVDLSNYVMLELGQPLHAFDYEKLIGGRIVVRKARPGERLTTLDGVDHELNPQQMIICDAERPIAAAGIMGGLETEVSESTTQVLLESAHFASTSVRRTRKQLGLSTEASYRFERSVDPEGVVAAIDRFGELLRLSLPDLTVGELVDVYPAPPSPKTVRLRIGRARRLLGVDVAFDEARHYLERLGFEVRAGDEEFEVVPPTWRPDVVREEDLIEEVGRVHGYEKIPERLPEGTTSSGGYGEVDLRANELRLAFVRLGFVETVSYSLRDVHPLDAPTPRVGPRNPGSPEMAWLRNSLWPSLADAARRNGGRNLHLMEAGRVFSSGEDRPVERRSIAALSTGELYPPARAKEPVPTADFFSLKGILTETALAAGLRLDVTHAPEADARLHPGRQAVVLAGETEVGRIGQIHPEAAEAIGLPAETVLLELDVDRAIEHGGAEMRVRPISRNPAVRRDISFLMDQSVPYAQVEREVSEAVGDVLERIWLFDVYEGQGVPEGKHALAVALQLRKHGENFTDEEANQVRERAVAAIETLGGTPR
jgi:phenylalanyl-tRNA synthetase beta chain